MYLDALAREQAMRVALAETMPTRRASRRGARAVVARPIEEVVRVYPASGYSDNALWQAGLCRSTSSDASDRRRTGHWRAPAAACSRRSIRPAAREAGAGGDVRQPGPRAAPEPRPRRDHRLRR